MRLGAHLHVICTCNVILYVSYVNQYNYNNNVVHFFFRVDSNRANRLFQKFKNLISFVFYWCDDVVKCLQTLILIVCCLEDNSILQIFDPV